VHPARIVDAALLLSDTHGIVAVTAAQKAHEKCLGSHGTPLEFLPLVSPALNFQPQLPIDDGLMLSLKELPGVGDVSGVGGAAQDAAYRRIDPGWLASGPGDPQEVEFLGYHSVALSLISQLIDPPYDLSLFVHHLENILTGGVSVAVGRGLSAPKALLYPGQHAHVPSAHPQAILYLREDPRHALHDEGGIGDLPRVL